MAIYRIWIFDTIHLSSNYLDGLHTRPISIRSLLLSAFYIHLNITTILLAFLLIFLAIFNNQLILPLISVYLYISGPMAFILMQNILFAKKFNLFPVQADFTIQQTFTQTVTKFISAALFLGCVFIIQFFSTSGCYFIIFISLITVMAYPYWINYLYRQFVKKKYKILMDLRNN